VVPAVERRAGWVDAVKAMLAETRGWTVELLADSRFLGGAYVEGARETVIFEMRGATLRTTMTYGYRGSCETDVTVAADGFSYKGCFLEK
jgi:hypothetical protein